MAHDRWLDIPTADNHTANARLARVQRGLKGGKLRLGIGEKGIGFLHLIDDRRLLLRCRMVQHLRVRPVDGTRVGRLTAAEVSWQRAPASGRRRR